MKKLIVLSALFFSGIMFTSVMAQDAKSAEKQEPGKEVLTASKQNCSKPESSCCSKKTSSAQAAKKKSKKACSAESGKSCCSKKTEAIKKEE